MPTIEISLPDDVETEINRLVEQDEFINRDQAVEELLTMGVSAYATTDSSESTTPDEELFTQVIDDQQDPALRDESDDGEYQF